MKRSTKLNCFSDPGGYHGFGRFSGSSQDNPGDEGQILIEKIRASKKLFFVVNMVSMESEGKSFWLPNIPLAQ